MTNQPTPASPSQPISPPIDPTTPQKNNKLFILALIALATLVVLGIYIFTKTPTQLRSTPNSTPSPQSTPTSNLITPELAPNRCSPESLTTSFDTQTTGSNLVTTIKLTNSSTDTCDIPINTLSIQGVPNVSIRVPKKPETTTLDLEPGQSAVATITRPLQPDCQQTATSQFSLYLFLNNNHNLFPSANPANDPRFDITTCTDPDTKTSATISHFSLN